MSAAFDCRELSKRYGATVALAGVDLEVQPGELVGLLGPNGAGKSTLVKIACGLVRPSGGRAEVCGAPAGSPSTRASPPDGRTRPHAIFTSVDFPAPLGPSSPTSSPGWTSRSTPASAAVAP